MAALVIAEHNNAAVKGATLNTVTAALEIGKLGGGDGVQGGSFDAAVVVFGNDEYGHVRSLSLRS